MSQIGRNLSDANDGILNGKRYLFHDRDPLSTAEFLQLIGSVGVKSVKLPPCSHGAAHGRRARTLEWCQMGERPAGPGCAWTARIHVLDCSTVRR